MNDPKRTYTVREAATLLRTVREGIDAAWNSPEIQAARARAKGTLDKVATLRAAEQDTYWDGVSRRLRARTLAMHVETHHCAGAPCADRAALDARGAGAA